MGSKKSFHKMLEQFAAQGFVAVTIQYRLAPTHRYPAQIEDTRAALRFLKNNASRWSIDSSKMVLLGASAGAHLAMLTAFLGTRTPEAVRAVVDISGPTDLRDWRMGPEAERNLQETTGLTSDRLLSDLLGVADRSDPLYSQASPLTQANMGIPPILIFHWKEDRAVAIAQVERLEAELVRHRAQHQIVWFEGKGHALNGPGVEQIVPRTIQFLNGVLGRR
jgi:acetyl esterase/lipase